MKDVNSEEQSQCASLVARAAELIGGQGYVAVVISDHDDGVGGDIRVFRACGPDASDGLTETIIALTERISDMLEVSGVTGPKDTEIPMVSFTNGSGGEPDESELINALLKSLVGKPQEDAPPTKGEDDAERDREEPTHRVQEMPCGNQPDQDERREVDADQPATGVCDAAGGGAEGRADRAEAGDTVRVSDPGFGGGGASADFAADPGLGSSLGDLSGGEGDADG